ncbi:hypothetical protein Pfo_016497 [Paulownia fortunei]|nr:hypothetical protein Pfo_016497 [Paulownia fortunei]
MLVPTKLNGAYHQSWIKSMIHALNAKNKIGFINGSILRSETEQPTDFALWNRCNSMLLSWLTYSMEPDLLKGVFFEKNALAIYQIQKSLASLSQGTMTVSSYYIKIQREEDRMMQFLMGLNDTFGTDSSNILVMSPLPNVRQAYSLIVQDETQRKMTSGETKNFLHCSKHCDHCNRDGHTIENCRTLKFHCKFCDMEKRCKFKNATWTSNNSGGQGNRSQPSHGNGPYTSSAANATDVLLFIVFLLLLLPAIGSSTSLTYKMPFSMEIYMKMSA